MSCRTVTGFGMSRLWKRRIIVIKPLFEAVNARGQMQIVAFAARIALQELAHDGAHRRHFVFHSAHVAARSARAGWRRSILRRRLPLGFAGPPPLRLAGNRRRRSSAAVQPAPFCPRVLGSAWVACRNTALASPPGDHPSLTRAELHVMGHCARRALTPSNFHHHRGR